jgi:hypothetical protein
VGTDLAADLDVTGPDPLDAPPDTGGFGVFASVAATMAKAAQHRYTDSNDRRTQLFQRMHQVPIGAIQVPIAGGAGVFQMNDLLMPKAGYMWSVRALTASGYSAGSVIVYKGGMIVGGAYTGGGDPRSPFAAAATNTFGRGEFLLDQGDALIVVCSGITLNANQPGVQINGAADCFERWLLPEYLM